MYETLDPHLVNEARKIHRRNLITFFAMATRAELEFVLRCAKRQVTPRTPMTQLREQANHIVCKGAIDPLSLTIEVGND